VPGTRDGQELGQALHDAHDERLDERIDLALPRLHCIAGMATEARG
jgi:hypothetical protein